MSDAGEPCAVELGEVTPARSRHAGRRSAVELRDELLVVGTAAGDVLAYDRSTLDERWSAETRSESASVVSAASFGDGVAVGERGPEGRIRVYDAATGERRWTYDTAADVGTPQKESRFFLPFVADVASGGDRLYVAARRYERDGDRRSFSSAVYAFDVEGEAVWTYETDASPISIDADGRRLGIAYNRCPGAHQHGLVVLDAETGEVRWEWDPGTDGQRRVGDVSLVDDGAVVASHGDYRGYRLGRGGAEEWRVDVATPTTVGDETLYAYPNHAHATSEGVVFVTGNTYSTEGRETESLHPREHTAVGYTPDGERAWTASVGGFASELGTAGGRVAVPGAQHFRTRDADVHGLRLFGTDAGPETSLETDGVVTAVALDGEAFAAVEEPVVYHDDGAERGTYRVLLGTEERA
ncbi:outer membrane protein assembly factor BamB family protein [Halopelagius longus]|uniref:Outer membrane protein assembly factor BamB, contains PQQ-like beta-propeller repeat n=1 Tax=Halopelagius longus TaxID=1236180 RepID=A0A1H0ZFG6_9EURY|nr:PQQ-binding-like beta-propeller repeat protein [Halopelagius longus]RDI70264.1 transcriptional regulator [Halopelagius longus]SDQ26124.1 Outer membrane protein assembly factor BamB, contains PQQ-like beta-propeller repeat [Halopelagius longus]